MEILMDGGRERQRERERKRVIQTDRETDNSQASTISTGLLARRLFVAVGPVRASDMQLLLARRATKVFFFFFFFLPNHVLYVVPYVGF